MLERAWHRHVFAAQCMSVDVMRRSCSCCMAALRTRQASQPMKGLEALVIAALRWLSPKTLPIYIALRLCACQEMTLRSLSIILKTPQPLPAPAAAAFPPVCAMSWSSLPTLEGAAAAGLACTSSCPGSDSEAHAAVAHIVEDVETRVGIEDPSEEEEDSGGRSSSAMRRASGIEAVAAFDCTAGDAEQDVLDAMGHLQEKLVAAREMTALALSILEDLIDKLDDGLAARDVMAARMAALMHLHQEVRRARNFCLTAQLSPHFATMYPEFEDDRETH